ncbi:DsbA family oxidoreductase [Parasphingopyxis marina]|uniref:DsbA family oxidoreductase n=1 Tax=Parasphingopyxis marina TaxID=2761622 RepID=A0A842I1H9_9SPHN|nr:DsbA family oxidoreductase [Parasphingopyxis marina]MBC2778060.1 DsbA family oxidoreductase [Parasphingopyxis marina]
MAVRLKIDFVSDVSCPWCVIGLRNLEAALDAIGDEIDATVRFNPFELNPDMPVEGVDRAEYFASKYRMPAEEAKARSDEIKARAEGTGFAMNAGPGFRVYNTFDAHRLLEWAVDEGRQRPLKHALFQAYFTDCRNIGDHETLADIAASVGLDRAKAMEVLTSGSYAGHVRAEQRHNRDRGIQSVPTIIINDIYVINGGQPAPTFEKALRHIAGEMSKPVSPLSAVPA